MVQELGYSYLPGPDIAQTIKSNQVRDMPTKTTDQAIRARVESFVTELTELVRASALESVREALGAEIAPAPARRPGRPRKAAGRKAVAPKANKARKKSGKRARRSAEDVQALADKVHAAIKADPGQGLGALAAGLGEDVKDVRRPLTLLMEAGRVRMEGNRRGATYHPSREGGGAKPGARKGGRKKAARKARTRKEST